MPTNNKYYAYFIPGKNFYGITDNWSECEKTVKGKGGARFKGFKTKAEAKEWIEKGAKYDYKPHWHLTEGIYFDSGTARGPVEISVTDEKGNNLLNKILDKKLINKFGKHWIFSKEATNNFGELYACYLALKIAIKTGGKNVFGDSNLIIQYWSQGIIKKNNVSSETYDLALKTTKLREKFEMLGGTITFISGDDNPADLGFHK